MLSWGKGGRELVRYYGYEWQYPIQIMNTHLFSSNQPISGRFIHRVHTEGGYSQHSRDGHHYHLAGGGTYTVVLVSVSTPHHYHSLHRGLSVEELLYIYFILLITTIPPYISKHRFSSLSNIYLYCINELLSIHPELIPFVLCVQTVSN